MATTEAEPASPHLASQVLRSDSGSATRRRLGSGCAAVDAALDGGLEYGRVSCISGEGGVGKTLLALHFIAKHLVSGREVQATVIDSVGTFDVFRLQEVVLSRLRDMGQHDETKQTHTDAGVTTERVPEDEILDRVKLMRVFDIEGLLEALDELKTETESALDDLRKLRNDAATDKQLEIPDSEDEGDEMLFDEVSPLEPSPSDMTNLPGEAAAKEGLLVIDNITSVINPLLKRNYVQAQAQLTEVLRALSQLARSSNMCILLINTAMSPRSNHTVSVKKSTQMLDHPSPEEMSSLSSQLESISIFESATVRPALGKTLSNAVDLYLLAHMLPKHKRDADMFYNTELGSKHRAELVNILEVLSDRWDQRVGNFGAFTVKGGIQLEDAF
ncbi:P-loop containing nucleoside triphosphate hydrolase protein [Trichodelitschia bisporula]|uniref:P-loop containing nucleoside triphosphate hydrolase protein n=1 Tax=Trichodelitschia bisporula TaxID=703511 RepID=A0A6G1I6J6_9PEZI|nr:P-loop containing nucleoside triphosphate hydrolase protein [Trichodelitschia bisporula]